MATISDAIFTQMAEILASMSPQNDSAPVTEVKARAVKELAEAHAWVMAPGQPHGGSLVQRQG